MHDKTCRNITIKTSNIPVWRVIQFLAQHREINTDWLLFGEGDMFGKNGIHKMRMTKNGEMLFTTENSDVNSLHEELKKLTTLLEEKETHLESLKTTLANQDRYLTKILDKL